MVSADQPESRIIISNREPGQPMSEEIVHVPNRSVDDEPRVSKKVLVTTDATKIAAAESDFDLECESRFAQALEALCTSEMYFSEHQNALELRRERACGKLATIMDDTSAAPRARMRSAFQLSVWGNESGTRFIRNALKSNSLELQRVALETIQEDYGRKLKLSFDQAENALVVLQLVESTDKEIQQLSISICVEHKVPGSEDYILSALEKGLIFDEKDALRSLVGVATKPASIARVLKSVQAEPAANPPSQRMWTYWSLKPLLEHADPAVAEGARQALHDHTLQYESKARYGQHLAEDFARTAKADAIPMLEDITANSRDPVSRMYAVKALARLQPDKAVELLLNYFRNERAGYVVCDTLAEHADVRHAQEILDVVAKNRTDLRIEVARLLWSGLGETGRVYATENLQSFRPDARMWLYWKINRLDIVVAANELESLGILKEPADKILDRMKNRRKEGPFGKIANFDLTDPGELTGVFDCDNNLLIFDAESDVIPCRHDWLIEDFSRITHERFAPRLSLQDWHQKHEEDFEAPYTVKFVVGERYYEFHAENYGDWYDGLAVQNAINFALADQGLKERFIPLAGDGQCAVYVFADPATFLPFAEKYQLPLAEDAAEAIRQGQEYEKRVLESLRGRDE